MLLSAFLRGGAPLIKAGAGLIAITRPVSPSVNQCQLTHLQPNPINFEMATYQHEEYVSRLQSLGLNVISLPIEPELPDSVFVEDCAVVFNECAIITRPGADSRKPEVPSVAKALQSHRHLFFIEEPGTLDGGDVIVAGKNVYVGLSGRSNQEAIDQIQNYLELYGYTVHGVKITECLHLKSAATLIGPSTFLVNPQWIDASQFGQSKIITVHPDEPNAANAIWIADNLLVFPSAYPLTAEKLKHLGYLIAEVPADELAKAEGAVTCCSLIFKE